MYAEYLIRLLAPLGVYDLEETSVSGGAVYALGDGLDEAAETIDYVEREGNTATAQEEGLDRRESLFARRPAASTPGGPQSGHRCPAADRRRQSDPQRH